MSLYLVKTPDLYLLSYNYCLCMSLVCIFYLPILYSLDCPHESEKQFCDWIIKKEPLANSHFSARLIPESISWYNSRINCYSIIFFSRLFLFHCIKYSIKCNGTEHNSLVCGIVLPNPKVLWCYHTVWLKT